MDAHFTRRRFINSSLLAAAGLTLKSNAFGSTLNQFENQGSLKNPAQKPQICIFSKHLHWLEDYYEMAQFARQIGFDGIDLTLRKGGHVLPERVEQDLPRAKEAIEKAGLKIHMLTTDILSANDSTEMVLKTASKLGITNYRMGWIKYKPDTSLPKQIESIKSQFADLAALNKKYNIRGDYQNHSGLNFGASVWDIWLAIKDIDPRYLGCQFDILHATVEGSNSWQNDLNLLKEHIQTIDVKDFYWAKINNKWKPERTSLGQGMINFKKYFELLKQYGITGPISMHFEYPLGGAENGAQKLSISRQQVETTMKADLNSLQTFLKEAQLL